MEQSVQNAATVLGEISQLDTKSELAQLILSMYEKILAGASLKDLRKAADDITAEASQNVI